MIIYFILLTYIFLLPIVLQSIISDSDKRQRWVAFLGVAAIFLVFSLKAPSVGIDIKGYQEQYYISRYMPWSNNDYVFFETGYILIEKFFSKLGVDFQVFTALIYFVECLALYLHISKFSNDAMMSLLIFICYLTFVFSMSGLRQVLAMSVCMLAYLLFYKKRPIPIMIGLIMIGLAITIHRSAYIFFIIPLVMLYSIRFPKFNAFVLGSILLLAVVGRVYIWTAVGQLFKRVDVGTSITLGGNFIFLVGIMVFCIFTYETYYGIGLFGTKRSVLIDTPEIVFEDTMCMRVAELCVIGEIIFSGDSMLRTVNYFVMLMVPLLPRMLMKYKKEQRVILQIGLILFLLFLFISQTLVINQLEISHYKFFWESV